MKRWISLLVSIVILAIIYWRIDVVAMLRIFKTCDLSWLIAGLGMVVPLNIITSWRFQQVMPPGIRVSFAEANRLILASSTLNMILPSKMGDIAKAWFMRGRNGVDGGMALSLVVFEKTCDMLSLLLWCLFGLLIYTDKGPWFWLFTLCVLLVLSAGLLFLCSTRFLRLVVLLVDKLTPQSLNKKLQRLWECFAEVHDFVMSNKLQALKIALVSVFLWFMHLLQIWWYTLALKTSVPFLASLAIAPLTIVAGMFPLTFGGIGTRDAAAILLYRPYFNATTGAALGLLLTSRYLLPALFGLPFLGRYLLAMKKT